MDKNRLREKIKNELISISPIDRKNKDEKIFQKLSDLKEFKNAKSIFTYVSWFTEVDTKIFISHIFEKNKEIYVPKIDLKNQLIEVYKINSFDDLKKGTYNILEPVKGKCDKINFDMIIIPGLGFDKNNNRLGRGGGYFDKFLKIAKGIKVGLCYKEQLIGCVPTFPHDIKMDMIITD